jgi:tRNA1Val (adenine37-N6)-methyltransferase
MSNDYFQFRQFVVHQQRCAMKVGTDGTLLGAWAAAPSGQCRILDIGTGTGLIALMMAQRFPEAEVIGIDIDEDAVAQADENVRLSPFSERIRICHLDILNFADTIGFDAIVSNPPYFVDSLACPDDQRTIARHAVSLTYEQLMHQAYHLLKDEGRFSVVVPSDCRAKIEAAACLEGFFTTRVCLIKTTPRKQPKRQLIEFQKHPVSELDISEGVIEVSPNVRSEWYQQLTKEFYIK